MTDLVDVIIDVDPEPCETCDTGIQYMKCWDGRVRCRNCVQSLARKMEWDKVSLSPEQEAPQKRTLLAYDS